MFERIEIDEVGAIKKVQLKPWLTVALSHAAQNFNYATDAEGGNLGQQWRSLESLLKLSGITQ
jgi:hypothetical protein